MRHDLASYKTAGWTGSIEDLLEAAAAVLQERTGSDREEISLRLVRDYISRGILGGTQKKGRELLFDYENLLRLVWARTHLADGWSLSKITEYLNLSSPRQLEEDLAEQRSGALGALKQLRAEADLSAPKPAAGPSKLARRAVHAAAVEREMRAALRRLGLPEDVPATEQLTLLAIAPWCQVLLQTDRLRGLTMDDADEVGRAVAGGLKRLITGKERR